jgi:hypothetical protein
VQMPGSRTSLQHVPSVSGLEKHRIKGALCHFCRQRIEVLDYY